MSSQTRLESLKLAIQRGLEEAGTLLLAAAYEDYIEMGMSQQKKAAMEQKKRRDQQKDK